jgi:hypothetical protein
VVFIVFSLCFLAFVDDINRSTSEHKQGNSRLFAANSEHCIL